MRARLAELRAAGEPVELADLENPAPDDELNAATYLTRSRRDLIALAAELHKLGRSDPLELLEDEQVLQRVKDAFDAHRHALADLDRALSCDIYHVKLGPASTPSVLTQTARDRASGTRSASRVLRWRAFLKIAEDNHDGALADCLGLLRLGRLNDAEPATTSHLVSVAIRGMGLQLAGQVLQSGAVSAEMHTQLEDQLAQYDEISAYQQTLKEERVVGLMFISSGSPNSWLTRLILQRQIGAYLELIDLQIGAISRPYSEAPVTPPNAPSMVASVAPALNATHEATVRMIASTRCLRILNALQKQNLTVVPAELQQAGLNLPDEVLEDPYDGGAISCRRSEAGWLIYSVGRNLVDDGGKIDQYEDVGVGPNDAQ